MDVLLTTLEDINTRLSVLEELVPQKVLSLKIASAKTLPFRNEEFENPYRKHRLSYKENYTSNLFTYSVNFIDLDTFQIEKLGESIRDTFITIAEASHIFLLPKEQIYNLTRRSDRLAAIKAEKTSKILIAKSSIFEALAYWKSIGGIDNDPHCKGISAVKKEYRQLYSNNPVLDNYIRQFLKEI